jgi:hydrogenase expression/formation protein HypE
VATIRDKSITMAHGGGGRAMRELIERLIVPAFANPMLATLEDQARIGLRGLTEMGDRLAFTTDSYVVSPLFFAGGDIGTLAICGTVNDLAMSGAQPLFLSCGLIIEEGFATADLERVLASMAALARRTGVHVVTGDTKVVNRGAADRLFINTAGIGVIAAGVNIAATRARPGDVLIVNGTLGDHGVAILVARNELELHATPRAAVWRRC